MFLRFAASTAIVALAVGCFPPQDIYVDRPGPDRGVPEEEFASWGGGGAPGQDAGPPTVVTPPDAGVDEGLVTPDFGTIWFPDECLTEDVRLYVDPAELNPVAELIRTRADFAKTDLYILMDRREHLQEVRDQLGAHIHSRLTAMACEPREDACERHTDCPGQELCQSGACVEGPSEIGCAIDLEVGLGTFDGNSASFRHEVGVAPVWKEPLADYDWAESSPDVNGDVDIDRALNCIMTDCGTAGCPAVCPGFRADAERVIVVVTDGADGCVPEPDAPCPENWDLGELPSTRIRWISPSRRLSDADPFEDGEVYLDADDAPRALETTLRDRRLVPMTVQLTFSPSGSGTVATTDLVGPRTATSTELGCAETAGGTLADTHYRVSRGRDICWEVPYGLPTPYATGVGYGEFRTVAERLELESWSFCAEVR